MTRLWQMRRRSGRQRRAVPMEGLLGSATIEGPWSRERWIGDVGRLHLGKYAAFGFGQVALSIQGRRRPLFPGDNHTTCEPTPAGAAKGGQ
jgi:hypothetical protein